MAKVTIDGAKELRYRLRRYPGELRKAAGNGEYAAAQDIAVEAKRRAPYEEGDLKDSIYAALPAETGDSVYVEIGAGGSAQAYAYAQHENDYNHPGARAVRIGAAAVQIGERYFLKNAVDYLAEQTKETIARYIRRFMETGKTRRPPSKVPRTPQ